MKSCIYHEDSFPKDSKRLHTSLWVTYLSYLPLTHRHDRFVEKLKPAFFPKSDSGVRAVMSWDSGDISVCVLRGLTLETQEPHQKQKRLLTFFFFLLPPFLLPYDDGLFFSSYSISLFGLSSFMSLDRLHSLRGSGFTISFCLGGNDKIIQGRIG